MRKKTDFALKVVLCCALIIFSAGNGFPSDFPAKPITLWIGYSSGGDTDIASRALAESAAKHIAQPIVVVNKPGGSGANMLTQLKAAKPDGYTVGLITMGALIASHMRKVPYECSKDFSPVIHFGNFIGGFAVKSDAPWKNMEEYLSWAEKNPGKARYSVGGLGHPAHLVMERIAMVRNIKLVPVPYLSGSEAAVALIGGHVPSGSFTSDWVPYTQPDDAGQMRCLMISSGKKLQKFPGIPTIREIGFDFEFLNMMGIVGPKGMPDEAVKILHDGLKKAIAEGKFVDAMENRMMTIVYQNSEDFDEMLLKTDAEVGSLIRKLELRKEE